MTLEKATDIIMTNTLTWVGKNAEARPGFIYTNFASFFIHECKILNQTVEFAKWHTLSWVKPRNLSFDFDDENELKSLSFYTGRETTELDGKITALNRLFSYQLGTYKNNGYIGNLALRSKLTEEAKKRLISTPLTLSVNTSLFETDSLAEKNKGLFDISKIKNFKF